MEKSNVRREEREIEIHDIRDEYWNIRNRKYMKIVLFFFNFRSVESLYEVVRKILFCYEFSTKIYNLKKINLENLEIFNLR